VQLFRMPDASIILRAPILSRVLPYSSWSSVFSSCSESLNTPMIYIFHLIIFHDILHLIIVMTYVTSQALCTVTIFLFELVFSSLVFILVFCFEFELCRCFCVELLFRRTIWRVDSWGCRFCSDFIIFRFRHFQVRCHYLVFVVVVVVNVFDVVVLSLFHSVWIFVLTNTLL
jgi:hypothetical protein